MFGVFYRGPIFSLEITGITLDFKVKGFYP